MDDVFSNYDSFLKFIIEIAERDELPVVLQCQEVSSITPEILQNAFESLYQDTGFQMTATFFLCEECGRLHMNIEIDNPTTNEIIQ